MSWRAEAFRDACRWQSRFAWFTYGAIICVQHWPASADVIQDRARAAAAASRSKTAKPTDLQTNFTQPGISGQQVRTIDGSRAFTPNLACQKTVNYLEALIQPGPTGDIGVVKISQDKNLDGTYDSVNSLPVRVSGICGNGIVSCAAGTWNNCTSYKWDVAVGGDLTLTPVDMSELKGCYCVNNSCGSNLVFNNLSEVLTDLGGGMVGALTTFDSRIGVARASVSGPVITYSAAQTTACTGAPAVTQTAYANSPTAIAGDAFSASTTSTVYQTLAHSPVGAGRAEQTRHCTIERNVEVKGKDISDIVQVSSGPYSQTFTAPNRIDFSLGSPVYHSLSGNCTIYTYQATVNVADPARLTSAIVTSLAADDYFQLNIDGAMVAMGPDSWTGPGGVTGQCERNGESYYPGALDITAKLKTQGTHTIQLRVSVGGRGEGFASIALTADTTCTATETITDLCAPIAADTSCRLDSEDVDGVSTWHNGVNTGLRPVPQTRIFGGVGCNLSLTRDFFLRDRAYRCVVNNGQPPVIDHSRAAYIMDNSTATLIADRINGQSTTRAFAMPARPAVDSCEQICKTTKPKVNTAASVAGVTGMLQNNPNSVDTFYHACSAGVCQAEDGETVVTACGCLDDFPQAAAMMQAVRLGGADLVCTTAPVH